MTREIRSVGLGLAALVASAASAAESKPLGIGLCVRLADVAVARDAGYDYVELSAQEVAGLGEGDFQSAAARLKASGIPARTANLFLPGSLKVTGPAVDAARLADHVERTLGRLAALGVETLVFGSGKAREVPEGFSRDEARRQLVSFGRLAADVAAQKGLVIALEPLRRQETNIVNTAAEGLALVEAVDRPAFQLLVDFYHLTVEAEDPAVVVRAGSRLRHVHIANPEGRVFPRDAAEAAYTPFFARLKEIGYTGGVSVEAGTTDLATDARRSAAFLRTILTPPLAP
jgi:D-psicose/D-tagatose/L-ribulose 3-epimerase